MTATAEFVVPKSIPIIFAMFFSYIIFTLLIITRAGRKTFSCSRYPGSISSTTVPGGWSDSHLAHRFRD